MSEEETETVVDIPLQDFETKQFIEKVEEKETKDDIDIKKDEITENENEGKTKINYYTLFYGIDWIVGIIFFVGFQILIPIFIPTFKRWLPITWMNETEYSYPEKEKDIFPSYYFYFVIAGGSVFYIVYPWIRMVLEKINWKEVLLDINHAFLGTLVSSMLSEICVETLKIVVGDYRPNYKVRCGPDHNGDCTIHDSEANKSFPSGHSSTAFEMLFFGTLYLLGKFRVFTNGGGSLMKLIICFIPSFFAGFIAVTRYWDFEHKTIDIFAGSCFGIASSIVGYFLYYPLLTSDHCASPKNRYKDVKKETFLKTLVEIIVKK